MLMRENYEFNIKKVNHTLNSGDHDKSKRDMGRKKEKKSEDEVKDHFIELTEAAERIHKLLVEKNSLFRFCVYREQSDIFIDLVILNEKGKIEKTVKKNITHQEFSNIIKHIETLDGFIVDYTI
jgi:hypothetical protein